MDKPEVILQNTRKSLRDLREQLLRLENHDEKAKDSGPVKAKIAGSHNKPGELWSCKFNSGLFAVDWEDTRKVLEEELEVWGKTVRVVSPGKS